MTNDQFLTKEEIMKIKAELLERRSQILSDLDEIVDVDEVGKTTQKVKFPEYGDKLDENAQEIDDYTTNLATDKVLESTVRDIDSALKRIEEGTYGVCKYCQKPIAKKRMLARPVASACVECKTKLQNQL
jgi:RNA polymerase-binding protein DksA